jgi:hypothetical protein
MSESANIVEYLQATYGDGATEAKRVTASAASGGDDE